MGDKIAGAEKQRVAVRLGLGDDLRAKGPTRARPVLDNHLLAERLAKLLGDWAGHRIHPTAGRQWDDQMNLPGRIVLRLRRDRRRRGQKRQHQYA